VFELGNLNAPAKPLDFSAKRFGMTISPRRHLWHLRRSTSRCHRGATRDRVAASIQRNCALTFTLGFRCPLTMRFCSCCLFHFVVNCGDDGATSFR
jgi:hypothetical protein